MNQPPLSQRAGPREQQPYLKTALVHITNEGELKEKSAEKAAEKRSNMAAQLMRRPDGLGPADRNADRAQKLLAN
jgi:hypothetical protein